MLCLASRLYITNADSIALSEPSDIDWLTYRILPWGITGPPAMQQCRALPEFTMLHCSQGQNETYQSKFDKIK